MEFTTRFGLHSQTTRLSEDDLQRSRLSQAIDGTFTLHGTPFQGIWTWADRKTRLIKLQLRSGASRSDFKFELFPLHSPLLGESLLVSFPPLIDMLKFSGSSCLI
jgi:hypothetical protein